MSQILDEHRRRVYNTPNLYTRIDSRNIPPATSELRMFVIARNESLRLPYFMDYYFKLGVDRVFLIDNDSTDNTIDIALSYDNVHVFNIEEGYRHSWYWMEYFLETYGKDSWCVVVDVDELVFYPHGEQVDLKELITYFDLHGFTAIRSLLLDMFSDKPVKDTVYIAGQDPLEICQYYDTDYFVKNVGFFDNKNQEMYSNEVYIGGVRNKVFGKWEFYLSKIPIFKFSDDTYLNIGMHAINRAKIADIRGVVFHTKFMHDFIQDAEIQAQREEFSQDSIEPKLYHSYLVQKPDLTMKDATSIKYKDSNQLIRYGLMKSSPNFDGYVRYIKEK